MVLVRLQSCAICGLSLLLVLDLLRGFFSGLPPFTKTNTPNSSSYKIEDLLEYQPRLMCLPLYKCFNLFIYLFLSDNGKYRSLLVTNCIIKGLFTLSIVFALSAHNIRTRHSFQIYSIQVLAFSMFLYSNRWVATNDGRLQ